MARTKQSTGKKRGGTKAGVVSTRVTRSTDDSTSDNDKGKGDEGEIEDTPTGDGSGSEEIDEEVKAAVTEGGSGSEEDQEEVKEEVMEEGETKKGKDSDANDDDDDDYDDEGDTDDDRGGRKPPETLEEARRSIRRLLGTMDGLRQRVQDLETENARQTRVRSSTRGWMASLDTKKPNTAPKLYASAAATRNVHVLSFANSVSCCF